MTYQVIEYLKNNSLQELQENFAIKTSYHKKHPELVALSYMQGCSPMGEQISQECRGLIVNLQTLKIVCAPLRKFFNFGEKFAASLGSKLKFYDKRDGTLINFYCYKGVWYCSTTGTADASGNVNNSATQTFAELAFSTFQKMGYNYQNLNPNYTYSFELTAPENQVVVFYNDASLHLLAVRDNSSLKELPVEHFSNQFKIVEAFNFENVEQAIAKASVLNTQHEVTREGFVVVDEDFNRIKIKSSDYLLWHRMVTKKDVLSSFYEAYLTDNTEEFLVYFPEYKEMFHGLISLVKAWEINTLQILQQAKNDPKTIGLQFSNYPLQKYAFQMLKTTSPFKKLLQNQNNPVENLKNLVEVTFEKLK